MTYKSSSSAACLASVVSLTKGVYSRLLAYFYPCGILVDLASVDSFGYAA